MFVRRHDFLRKWAFLLFILCSAKKEGEFWTFSLNAKKQNLIIPFYGVAFARCFSYFCYLVMQGELKQLTFKTNKIRENNKVEADEVIKMRKSFSHLHRKLNPFKCQRIPKFPLIKPKKESSTMYYVWKIDDVVAMEQKITWKKYIFLHIFNSILKIKFSSWNEILKKPLGNLIMAS